MNRIIMYAERILVRKFDHVIKNDLDRVIHAESVHIGLVQVGELYVFKNFAHASEIISQC